MNMRYFLRQAGIVTGAAPVVFPLFCRGVAAEPEKAAAATVHNLDESLSKIRAEHDLPALAGGARKGQQLVALGGVGVRKVGADAAVATEDKFHIGSCTKAMTASLAAMFVDSKDLKWDTTLGDIFGSKVPKMHETYRKTTLEVLLTHRSGAPHDGRYRALPDVPVKEQRVELVKAITSAEPKDPGDFAYSNAGYVMAGAMIEQVSGKIWEDLMKERIFKPLGMSSAGFGPTSKPKELDGPWGHVLTGGKFQPRFGDNPPVLGPAGTVHCTVSDYLKFASWHGSEGKTPAGLLDPKLFEKLHQPEKGNYAMGWGVVRRPWAKGKALTHAGSNTMNYFVVWVAPAIGLTIAAATNCAGEKVPQAVDQVAGELVRKYA